MAAVGHHVPPGLTCTTLHMYWSTSSPSSRADLLQGGVTLDTGHQYLHSIVVLLAHGALPHPLLAVELEVGLQVEALDVSALVAPGRHPHPPEGQGAAQAHLKKEQYFFYYCLFIRNHNLHNSH